MKCPSCGNSPRSGTGIYFSLAPLEFRCQYCNERLRGNALMVALDVAYVLLYGILVLVVLQHGRGLARALGEYTVPALVVGGICAVRVPIVWLETKIGEFRSVE